MGIDKAIFKGETWSEEKCNSMLNAEKLRLLKSSPKTYRPKKTLAEVAGWTEWRQEAQRLAKAGRALLTDEDTYGVNRSPIVFGIADNRPEREAERPVTDSEVRAYLAERWSRSAPKEAALDYVSDGAWRDASERAGAVIGSGATRTAGTRHGAPGNGQGVAPEAREATNDNAIVRIAQRKSDMPSTLALRSSGGRLPGRSRRDPGGVGRVARAGA